MGHQISLQGAHRRWCPACTRDGAADLRALRDRDPARGSEQGSCAHPRLRPASHGPSEIMRQIKGRTSSKLFEEFPMLKKRYWRRHFWARGYFCATIGQMTEEM